MELFKVHFTGHENHSGRATAGIMSILAIDQSALLEALNTLFINATVDVKVCHMDVTSDKIPGFVTLLR